MPYRYRYVYMYVRGYVYVYFLSLTRIDCEERELHDESRVCVVRTGASRELLALLS